MLVSVYHCDGTALHTLYPESAWKKMSIIIIIIITLLFPPCSYSHNLTKKQISTSTSSVNALRSSTW